MRKRNTQTERISGRFGSALAFMAILLANFPVQAQYESFFGRESWEYNIVYLETCKEYDPNLLGFCCMTETFFFSKSNKDTIAGKEYYKNYGVFLREDTINGVLYARYSQDEQSPEYVLCDLSLAVGDTFIYHYYPESYSAIPMIVDSISYVSQKKMLHLSIVGEEPYSLFYTPFYGLEEYNISLRFMEGVGPIYGVRQAAFFDEDLGLLLCMHKDDSLVYMTHEDLGCYQIGIDGIPHYSQAYLQVYPNPSNNQITVEFISEEDVSGIVVIQDEAGRVCQQFAINGRKNNYDISYLPRGVYVLVFIDEKGQKISRIIVKR